LLIGLKKRLLQFQIDRSRPTWYLAAVVETCEEGETLERTRIGLYTPYLDLAADITTALESGLKDYFNFSTEVKAASVLSPLVAMVQPEETRELVTRRFNLDKAERHGWSYQNFFRQQGLRQHQVLALLIQAFNQIADARYLQATGNPRLEVVPWRNTILAGEIAGRLVAEEWFTEEEALKKAEYGIRKDDCDPRYLAALARASFTHWGQVALMAPRNFYQMPGMGPMGMKNIADVLDELGFTVAAEGFRTFNPKIDRQNWGM
jgi:hypothetical protein